MKKLFFFAALAIVLVTASCSKSSNPGDRDQYIGTFYPSMTVQAQFDGDTAGQKHSLILADKIEITADPDDANGLIFTGKIIKGKATVSDQGFKLEDFTYGKEWDGTLTDYGCNLTIVNDYGTLVTVGNLKTLTWKSTFSGKASGALIGIGAEKSVTGTITNIAPTNPI